MYSTVQHHSRNGIPAQNIECYNLWHEKNEKHFFRQAARDTPSASGTYFRKACVLAQMASSSLSIFPFTMYHSMPVFGLHHTLRLCAPRPISEKEIEPGKWLQTLTAIFPHHLVDMGDAASPSVVQWAPSFDVRPPAPRAVPLSRDVLSTTRGRNNRYYRFDRTLSK